MKPQHKNELVDQLVALCILLGQWLNFKLFGITYLVGKIKFKPFISGSIGKVRYIVRIKIILVQYDREYDGT